MQEEMLIDHEKTANKIIEDGIEHFKSIEMHSEYVDKKAIEKILGKLTNYCGFTSGFARELLQGYPEFKDLF